MRAASLLTRVERYLTMTGMAHSRFGRLVAHDPHLVSDLRSGRIPKPENVTAIMAFMSANRPKPQRRDNGKQA